MAISRAAGFPSWSAIKAPPAATYPVSPVTLGDILLVGVFCQFDGNYASSISGGGVTTWHALSTNFDIGGTSNQKVSAWWGVVTGTGSQTLSVTYSGSVSGDGSILVFDELTAGLGAGTVWSVIASGTLVDNPGGTTTKFPSVSTDAGGATNEVYWGYGQSQFGFSSGASAGFTYSDSGTGNHFYEPCIALDASLAASTAYQPTYTLGTAGGYAGALAAIFKASTGAYTSVLTVISTQTPATIKVVGKKMSVVNSQSSSAQKTATHSPLVTSTQTPSVAKGVNSARNLSSAQTGSVIKRSGSVKSVTLQQSPVISRSLSKSISITQTESINTVKGITRLAFSLTTTEASIVIKAANKLLSGSQTQMLSRSSRIAKNLSFSQTQTPVFGRSLGRSISVTQTEIFTISKSLAKLISVMQTESATYTDSLSKTIRITQNETPAAVKKLSKAILVTQASTITAGKNTGKNISGAPAQLATLIKGASKNLSIIQIESPAITRIVFRTISISQVESIFESGIRVRLITFSLATSQVPNLSRTMHKALAGSLTEAPTHIAILTHALSTSLAIIPSISRLSIRSLGITQIESAYVQIINANLVTLSVLEIQTIRRTGLLYKPIFVLQNETANFGRMISKSCLASQILLASKTVSSEQILLTSQIANSQIARRLTKGLSAIEHSMIFVNNIIAKKLASIESGLPQLIRGIQKQFGIGITEIDIVSMSVHRAPVSMALLLTETPIMRRGGIQVLEILFVADIEVTTFTAAGASVSHVDFYIAYRDDTEIINGAATLQIDNPRFFIVTP